MGFSLEKKRDFLQVDPCNPGSPNLPVHGHAHPNPNPSPQREHNSNSPQIWEFSVIFHFHAQVLTYLIFHLTCNSISLPPKTADVSNSSICNLSKLQLHFHIIFISWFYLWNDGNFSHHTHFLPILSGKKLPQLFPTTLFKFDTFKKSLLISKTARKQNWGNINGPVHGWRSDPRYMTKKNFKYKHSSLLMTYLGLILL